ncbi:uncharacterized protein [Anabrus simplex]|uniref:uncharacterized protein n=1 Tax=Anabrus simplex TaxID=316456 RepID=UPI0034DCFAB3
MSAVKRRRQCIPTKFEPSNDCDQYKRPLGLLDLPTELLTLVFRWCTFSFVAETLRLVCRRFRAVATLVLNSGMAILGPRLERAMARVEYAAMNVVATEGDLITYSRAFNALEIIHSQFRVVYAVTWRYVLRGWNDQPPPPACFYGGRLLDTFYNLLWMADNDPEYLGLNFHFHHKLCTESERQKLFEMMSKFLFHFEKYTERVLNKNCGISGAKIVDLLDCLQEEDARRVHWYASGLDLTSGIYHYSATYMLRHSWFTALDIIPSKNSTYTWSGEQRFMYLRIRRLVTNHNDHSLEHTHYERELVLHSQSPLLTSIAPPLVSLYSGHGEYAGKFYYYGNMNESAYESRFIRNHPIVQDTSEELSAHQVTTHCSFLPSIDLKITVELHCPMHLAPLAAYKSFQPSDFERHTFNDKDASKFKLQLKFDCSASSPNRLPSTFNWQIPAST